MRISYVGNFEPEWSTENDVRKAFESLGHEVIKLQEGDERNPNKVSIEKIKEEALNSDMLLWTGTWGDAYKLEDVLDLFHELAKKKIPSATLHLDTFWATGRDGRKWWREPMFFTSAIFTADGDYEQEWKLLGRNHFWMPPAVRHDAVKFGKKKKEYECDVAFVGSNGQGYHEDVWTYRKELVDALRDMCKRNNWSFKNPGGDDPKVPRDDEMNNFYASAKVTVGDSLCLNKEKSYYWSDRVPEATGRGGLLIMPRIDFLQTFYPTMPMYEWGDFEGLEEMIRSLLKHPKERKVIQKSCHRITKHADTYVHRAQAIIDKLDLGSKDASN